jgi:hypothetical protein
MTDVYESFIEAGARAIWAESGHDIDDLHPDDQEAARWNARTVLSAARAHVPTEVCQTCGGTGDCVREVASPVGGDPYLTRVGDCPDCEGSGRRPSDVRLMLGRAATPLEVWRSNNRTCNAEPVFIEVDPTEPDA